MCASLGILDETLMAELRDLGDGELDAPICLYIESEFGLVDIALRAEAHSTDTRPRSRDAQPEDTRRLGHASRQADLM